MTAGAIEQLARCENERIRALIDKDVSALRAMIDKSLVHVHTTGRVEDQASYLAGVANNLEFLEITRGPLNIRVFGDAAIMTGPLDQRVRVLANMQVLELASTATQVWIRSEGRWRLTSFHACPRA